MIKEEIEQLAKEYVKKNIKTNSCDIPLICISHMVDFANSINTQRKDRDDKAQTDNELIMMKRIEELEKGFDLLFQSKGIDEFINHYPEVLKEVSKIRDNK